MVEPMVEGKYVIEPSIDRQFRVHFDGKNVPVLRDRYISLTNLAMQVHEANRKWWHDIHTGRRVDRNTGELIALMHSELSEALEGSRKGLQDDHLPQYEMVDVEMVDCMIRILDFLGSREVDVEAIFLSKMMYNALREDHSHEARRNENGKKF
jgi:hypothetical protein